MVLEAFIYKTLPGFRFELEMASYILIWSALDQKVVFLRKHSFSHLDMSVSCSQGIPGLLGLV